LFAFDFPNTRIGFSPDFCTTHVNWRLWDLYHNFFPPIETSIEAWLNAVFLIGKASLDKTIQGQEGLGGPLAVKNHSTLSENETLEPRGNIACVLGLEFRSRQANKIYLFGSLPTLDPLLVIICLAWIHSPLPNTTQKVVSIGNNDTRRLQEVLLNPK
jgi:hypothetical protein